MNKSLLPFYVLYDVSGRTAWAPSYIKRCRNHREEAIRMGQNQMLKDFRVKRENIIRLGTGRNNKMATGRSSSTQPFTPALDRRLLASLAWLKRKEKMIWH